MGSKGIFIGVSILATLGLVYYFAIYKKNTEEDAGASQSKSICADFIVDGSVFNLDKTKMYDKKKGDWAGCHVSNSLDNEYYKAVNSEGKPILLKKSEVKTR